MYPIMIKAIKLKINVGKSGVFSKVLKVGTVFYYIEYI